MFVNKDTGEKFTFEIIGLIRPKLNGQQKYPRILIRKKSK